MFVRFSVGQEAFCPLCMFSVPHFKAGAPTRLHTASPTEGTWLSTSNLPPSPPPPLTSSFLPPSSPTWPCPLCLDLPTCCVDTLPVVCVSWLTLGAPLQTRTRKILPTTCYRQERGTLRYQQESPTHPPPPYPSPSCPVTSCCCCQIHLIPSFLCSLHSQNATLGWIFLHLFKKRKKTQKLNILISFTLKIHTNISSNQVRLPVSFSHCVMSVISQRFKCLIPLLKDMWWIH